MQEETQVPSSPVMAATAVEATATPVPVQTVVPVNTVEFASFWARLGAVLIDSVILSIFSAGIFSLGSVIIGILGIGALVSLKSQNTYGTATAFGGGIILVYFLLFLTVVLVNIGYFVFSVAHGGATLGKKALGIKVVDESGKNISYSKAFLREVLGKFVSGAAFDIGYLWVLFDPQKQAWHDKLAKTFVIKSK